MYYSKIILKKEKTFMSNTYFTHRKGLCPNPFETPCLTGTTPTI